MQTLTQTKGSPSGKRSHSLLKGPKAASDKKGKSGKLTSTKNKIRGVERLLRKAGVDNKLRRSLDAKLSELQESLKKHNQEELQRKFAVRYHKIRFFERIKLERRIKQLKGKAQRGHALSAVEQQNIQKLEQDLQYVLHFPKGERYVSILKDAAEPEAQAKLDAERTRLKAVIKHQLAESALLTEADEGLGLAELHAKAKPDSEGDAFFLDSGDDTSSAEALISSALPVSLSRGKRGHADFTASVAQKDARLAQPAQCATGVVCELLPARRQALAGSLTSAVKRLRTGSKADVSGLGSAHQDPQEDRPLALQSSQHTAEQSIQAQLMPGETHQQSATKRDSATRKQRDDSRQAVSRSHEAAGTQAGRSAASRSQLLLQRLEQKYAKSRVQSRPDMAPLTASAQRLPDMEQPSKLALGTAKPPPVPVHALRPPAVGKFNAMPKARQIKTPQATGSIPVRTRAEGGRRRRK